MRTFTINKVTYTASLFDFNMVCELEDRGISLEKAQERPLSMMRAYLAVSSGMSDDEAGNEIQKHLINGGEINDILDVIRKEMEESDFFQALSKGAEKETPKTQKTTKTTK